MADDVDPENPHPEEHYPRYRNNEWYYVPDELAETISVGPADDGEEGQDWALTHTPERRDASNREEVLVRLTPRALHELYIEVKDLNVEAQQMGHCGECDLCGEMADLDLRSPMHGRGVPQATLGRVYGRARLIRRPWIAKNDR